MRSHQGQPLQRLVPGLSHGFLHLTPASSMLAGAAHSTRSLANISSFFFRLPHDMSAPRRKKRGHLRLRRGPASLLETTEGRGACKLELRARSEIPLWRSRAFASAPPASTLPVGPCRCIKPFVALQFVYPCSPTQEVSNRSNGLALRSSCKIPHGTKAGTRWHCATPGHLC